jgi:transglutaminase-like putative cysteine protease
MEYLVRHRTTYRYLQDVSYSCHEAHLGLRETPLQQVISSQLTLNPPPASRSKRKDYFGNPCEWFTLDQPHALLEVLAESQVRVAPAPDRDAATSQSWESVRHLLEEAIDAESRDAVQFIFDSPLTSFKSDVAAYAAISFPEGTPMLTGAIDLMRRIHADFRYDTTVTDATTPVDRVFEIRAGVCQDLAHVGIACMRSLGLPARYVSGYLLTQPPPGQERLLGADASHAWFSVWAPSSIPGEGGWVDLDPTNDILVGEKHVTVAYGRDYGDVAPLNGIILGGHDHLIEVGVDVIPARR